MEEVLNMTERELHRINVIQQLNDKRISQVKAAEILHLSDRQIRNLLQAFQRNGPQGLISKRRGKPSNRAFGKDYELKVVSLILDHYEDFGPTFAREKLVENHGLDISVESVRKLMIKYNLHVPKKKRRVLHQSRQRRENFGELIQIDASIHEWFEDRGEKCALIVFIDDATSKITSLHFSQSECVAGYFAALESHLLEYGRPLAIYSDRHAIFGGAKQIKCAQFVRALNELNVESILARSPQAKGRVERANRTLQDRLIKEMRLRGISDIESGNAFLGEFLQEHNRRFSKEPMGQIDTHRPLESGLDLGFVLAHREERTVSNDLCISFNNKRIKILEPNMTHRLKGKKVNVIESKDGALRIYYRDGLLRSELAERVIAEDRVMDYKDKILWEPKGGTKPKKDHPWKKYGYRLLLSNKIKRMEKRVI